MSLWSIAQSPPTFGGDLPSNDEVLAVDRKGAHGRAFAEGGPSVVRTADAVDSDAKYVAVFNWCDGEAIDMGVDWPALKPPETCLLRDLRERKDVGTIQRGYTFRVEPHGRGCTR